MEKGKGQGQVRMKLCNPSGIRCNFVLKQEETGNEIEGVGRKGVRDYLTAREPFAGIEDSCDGVCEGGPQRQRRLGDERTS